MNPLPYHALLLALCLINACLVYLWAELLEFKSWQAFVAGLYVLFMAVASEVYFWISCTGNAMMTGTVLLALIFLTQFRRKKGPAWGLGYLALVSLAPLIESKGVILPLLGLFLDIYLLSRPAEDRPGPSLLTGWKVHILAFSVDGLVMLGRRLAGVQSYVIKLPLEVKFRTLKATTINNFFHGLDDHLWYFLKKTPALFDRLPSLLWWLMLILIGLTLIIQRGTARRRFLALTLMWLGACLPHVLAANLQFRYLYLPGVFAAFVVVDLWSSLSLRLLRTRAAYVLIALVLAGYVCMDLRGLHTALGSYREASQIYDAGIKHLQKECPTLGPDSHLVLVDFPFLLWSRQGSPRKFYLNYYIYPYSFLPYHLKLLYNVEQIDLTFYRLSPPSTEIFMPLGDPISDEKIAEMQATPGTTVVRYLPESQQFVTLKERNRRLTVHVKYSRVTINRTMPPENCFRTTSAESRPMSHNQRIWLVWASYLVLGLIVFHGALSLGFWGDDPALIWNSQRDWFPHPLNHEGIYQFFPHIFAITSGLYHAFHLNALPYHALLPAVCLINACLVYLWGELLGFTSWQAFAAGLFALFNSVASEVYFWFCCLGTVMMTGTVVMALINNFFHGLDDHLWYFLKKAPALWEALPYFLCGLMVVLIGLTLMVKRGPAGKAFPGPDAHVAGGLSPACPGSQFTIPLSLSARCLCRLRGSGFMEQHEFPPAENQGGLCARCAGFGRLCLHGSAGIADRFGVL